MALIWSFGGFELDEERFELRRGSEIVELRRKVFDVLRYLVTHGGRLVSKDELLQSVWPRETIHEGVVAQNIAILRRALGDSRDEAKLIQTVHGRGYRFIADVSNSRPGSVSPPARQPLPSAQFFGREHVMHELRRLLRTALGGRGAFAVLGGDAGIGKTRTAAELASEATALGALVLEGRCHEADGAPAFWPWVQVLRAAARERSSGRDELRSDRSERSDEAGSEVAQLLDALRGTESPRVQLPAVPETRFRLFDTISEYLARLARTQPLVLIFDDLHWADEATLHLLRFVARELRSVPLLVLGTSREVDARAEGTTSALLSSLLGGADVQRIYLEGLSHAATCALAEATLQRDLGELTLRDLHSLTEGNPFFVHEVLRLLADEHGDQRDQRANRHASWQAELPRRVREVIGLRLQRLEPDAQRLLALASVIGREFSVAVLEQVAGLPRAELMRLLEAAAGARLVRETVPAFGAAADEPAPAGRYAFAHALIRESLYAGLSEPERVRVHEKVGHGLEALFGVDADAHLDELAYHFHRAASAGDVQRAVMYCSRAAAQALSLLAFEQAVLNYRRALDALACRLPIDELQRFELKLALGSALFRAGDDGNPALLGAAEIARRLGRADMLAQVVLAMCGWPRLRSRGRTNNHALYPLLAETIALTPNDTSALRVRLLSALALNCPDETPLAVQLMHAREALELARGVGDDEALYDALLARLYLMQGPEDTARRLALAGELLEVAQRIGQKERMFTAHELRVQPLIALGDLTTADREIASCAQLALELRLPRCRLQVLRFQMERALGDGRYDEIRPLTDEAVRLRGRAELSPGYLATFFIWSTYERTARGKRAWFDRNMPRTARSGAKSALMHAHIAYVYASFGSLDEARKWYLPLVAPDALDATRSDDRPMLFALLADVVHACGDRESAVELYPRLLPHASLNVAHHEWWVYFGSAAYWLGLLAALLGEPKTAAAHFETALETNASLGARPALARTSLAYARVLLRSGHTLPRPVAAHARSLLRDAIAMAEELEMRPLAREAQQLSD